MTPPTSQLSASSPEDAAIPAAVPPPNEGTAAGPSPPESDAREFALPAPPERTLSAAQEKRLLYATIGAVAACVFVIVGRAASIGENIRGGRPPPTDIGIKRDK